MKPDVLAHIEIFRKYASPEVLSDNDQTRAVSAFLELPFVKRMLVFSDQAVVLVDLRTMKYLYVSPSVEAITGYTPEEFKDFDFRASVMPPGELKLSVVISEKMMSRIGESNLTPADWFRLRSTRNARLITKDGRTINMLEHGFVGLVSSDGLPLIQFIVATDITSFNSSSEYFYSLALMVDGEDDNILLSEKLETKSGLLTARERGVLTLLSHGLSTAAIGKKLGITSNTVKTHNKNLLRKTNTTSRINLVRYGYAHGWL